MKALRGLDKYSGGWWWSKSDHSVCHLSPNMQMTNFIKKFVQKLFNKMY